MDFILYLSTHFNLRSFDEYPHKNDDIESDLINNMYKDEIQMIHFGGSNLDFQELYYSFLSFGSMEGREEGSKVKVEDRGFKEEKLTKGEFERLAKNCPKKCSNCSFVDCWLLHGWKRVGDEFWHTYPLLGEYLPDKKKVILYVKNIDDVCRKRPTYNGVLSTYIHELFHAYFHYVTEQKQTDYNYIREIEEAMTEFSTLVFLRVKEEMYGGKWSEILEWTKEFIRKKQEAVGILPAYGFGHYLFDNIPEKEAFVWINKYAERLGFIDEEDELVKQYKQMVCPSYPTDPKKCLELLRKILFETSNNPISPREVKKSDDGVDNVVIVDYTPPYDSFCWKGEIHIKYDPSTDDFNYCNGFMGSWDLSDEDIARIKAFLKDENNLLNFFDDRKAYSVGEAIKTEHDRTYTLRIKWRGMDKTIRVDLNSVIPFKHPF